MFPLVYRKPTNFRCPRRNPVVVLFSDMSKFPFQTNLIFTMEKIEELGLQSFYRSAKRRFYLKVFRNYFS